MNTSLAPESLGRAELVFALGVGLLLVSGLLPWIGASEPIPVADPSEEAEGLQSFGADSTSEEILGIDRIDWVVLAGVGLVATVLVVTEPWSQVVLGVAGASGLAAGGLGAVYLVDPAWMYSDWIKSDVAAVASAGPGVYLALVSSLVQFGGCYLGYTSSTSTTGAQQLDAPGGPGKPQRPARERPQSPGRQPRRGPPGQRDGSRQPPQGSVNRDQPPHDNQQSLRDSQRPPQNQSQQGTAPPEGDTQNRPPENRSRSQPPREQPRNRSPAGNTRNRSAESGQRPPAREGNQSPQDSGEGHSAGESAADSQQGVGSDQNPPERTERTQSDDTEPK